MDRGRLTGRKVEHINAEVLIIGGGIAGMMAAVGAVRCGVTPVLVTKGTYASGSSSMARGGHSIAIGHSDPADNPELFFEDTIKGSYGIANPRLAELMCRESIDRTLELDAWGLGLVKLPDGRFEQKKGAFPHRYARMVHCGRLMGKPLMAAVSKKTQELGIAPLEHVMLVDLLREGERVVGAWGFRYRKGVPVLIHAHATVLATGGAPQIHALNDSPPTITGDGYAIALRAGAELIDMEFIDYQLITAAPSRLAGYPPHSSGFLNAGGYLLNKNGERFMKRYDPERMERSTRALINRAVAIEIFEGRGTENSAVYIDIRHVFDKANEGASADVVKMFRNSGVDMQTSLLEVTSCPHTYLGGVRIDEWGRTTIKGLYAGGEAAGGIHGANRLGGAALIDSYVFGYRAGTAAACESREFTAPNYEDGAWQEKIDAAMQRMERTSGNVSAAEWRKTVQQLVVSCLGQVRRADRLTDGLRELDQLETKFDELSIDGDTDRQRFDCFRQAIETRNLIEVARMLGTAALSREESRGGQFRLDFPDIDDRRFLGNIVLWRDKEKIQCEFRTVPDRFACAPVPTGAELINFAETVS
jgi:fumarate reductase (CoM/CoB) subunit A